MKSNEAPFRSWKLLALLVTPLLVLVLLTLGLLGVTAVARGDDNGDGGGLPPTAQQCPPPATSLNHVVNGDFESVAKFPAAFEPVPNGDPGISITAWAVSGDGPFPVDHIGSYWEAASGLHSVDMNGTPGRGILTQNVPTDPGETYLLCFAYAANPDLCPREDDRMQVLYGGQVVATVTANCAGRTHQDMGWEYTQVTVTGEGVAPLQFESLTGDANSFVGIALDDVSLVQECPDDDADDDGLRDEAESLFGGLLDDADSNDNGVVDGNEDSDGDGEDDEDEDDDEDDCPNDDDGDGEDDEDEDD